MLIKQIFKEGLIALILIFTEKFSYGFMKIFILKDGLLVESYDHKSIVIVYFVILLKISHIRIQFLKKK